MVLYLLNFVIQILFAVLCSDPLQTMDHTVYQQCCFFRGNCPEFAGYISSVFGITDDHLLLQQVLQAIAGVDHDGRNTGAYDILTFFRVARVALTMERQIMARPVPLNQDFCHVRIWSAGADQPLIASILTRVKHCLWPFFL